MNLLTVTFALAVSIGTAYAVTCDVGTGSTTITMSCPDTDKCVWSKVNELEAKVCYSHMDWSKYPAFNARLGCQEFSAFGIYTKICICKGYRCNKNDPGSSSSPDRPVPSVTVQRFTTRRTTTSSSLTCDVGTGDFTKTMSCPDTDKCVWSKVDELEAKVCYSHMDWSKYPEFNPRLGCQEFSAYGITSKICICKGYRCNRNDPGSSGGSSHMYATSISTLLVFAVAICLL